MIRLDLGVTVPQWIFTTCVGAIGKSGGMNVMRLAIQASAADEDMAHVAAMVMTFRLFGMSLSSAILCVILQNVFQKLKYSSFSGPVEGLAQDVLGIVGVIKRLPNDSHDKLSLCQNFAESLKIIWATLMAFNRVSPISSFLTKELSLERILNTSRD